MDLKQAKESAQENSNAWKEGFGDTGDPRMTGACIFPMWRKSLRRNSEASRDGEKLSFDVIFLEALDPVVPKACPTSGL